MIKSLFDETEENPQAEVKETNLPQTEIEQKILPEEFPLESPAFNDPEKPISHDAEIIKEPATQFDILNPGEPILTTKPPEKDEPMLFQMQAKPESTAETARKSGLAMSAAIALFGSVAFLLIIGWFTDLLLGTSPWGIVGGIVLGSIIGFLQFFRTTSQILKNKD